MMKFIPMSLAAAALVLCAQVAVANPEGYASDEEIAQAGKWAESGEPEERLKAVRWMMEAKHVKPPVELLGKLLKDENPEVSGSAMNALQMLAKGGEFPLEDAKAFLKISGEGLSREALDELASKDFPQPETERLVDRMIATNALYQWYPLESPLSYENWQAEEYGYYVRVFSLRRVNAKEGIEKCFFRLVYGLSSQHAFHGILDRILDVEELTPELMAGSLEMLWQHPYCGAGMPMNAYLRWHIRKHLTEIKAKCRRADGSYTKEVARIFEEVEWMK